MAELTVADLQDTYIKLAKKAKCFASPEHGDKNKPVWFEKQEGEIAGKLFSYVTKNPSTGKPYKHIYLMFKVNDDYSTGSKSYFIRLEKKMIVWAFTKQQLIQKSQANMSLFDKFVDDMERAAQDYIDDVKANVESGLKTGLAIVAGVFLTVFVIVPEIKFRRLKSTAKEIIREAKN